MKVEIISKTAQEFNGKRYWLCGKYFQRKGVRLHRVVWEYHFGEIPKESHIHHIDHDRTNNQIENLECKAETDHLCEHMQVYGRNARNAEYLELGREKAAEWHKSENGKKWHRENFEKYSKKLVERTEEKKCQFCGQSFMAIYAHKTSAKFCSNNCKSAHRRTQKKDLETRICPACNASFEVNKYYETKCCSRKCAQKQRLEKRQSS